MREVFQHRGMRLLFAANLISMVGSGLNAAAVIWYILQATHSEVSLGLLVALQTLPSLVLLPFTGVIIDREDRRHLMMWLDVARGLVVLVVAVLALTHRAQVWQLYGMVILVSVGFWMFWPTINALVQELSPEEKLLDSNSLMLAAVQGGWVLAGAVVGFVYNKIGLGGILLLDCATYAVSIACVYRVRQGRVTVTHPKPESAKQEQGPNSAVGRYLHELAEGFRYVHHHRQVRLLGMAWALFIAAMMTQGVISAPLSERILHRGAVGYGWLNAGWAFGAFTSMFYAAQFIRRNGTHRSVTLTMCVIGGSLLLLPAIPWIVLAVPIYFFMGSGRGVGGIAIQSEMMEMVPKYFMGRTQNTFFFVASALQIFTALLAGEAAHHDGLRFGFYIVSAMYFGAAFTAWQAVKGPETAMEPDKQAG
jgi:MFS transporter, DHA3 family, macrolide efflux protein